MEVVVLEVEPGCVRMCGEKVESKKKARAFKILHFWAGTTEGEAGVWESLRNRQFVDDLFDPHEICCKGG